MRTSKPIATISFNTPEYLEIKLGELLKSKIIEFWCYIEHLPEEDTKKPHCHVYMIPAKMLQTMDLKEHFNEPDPDMPDKPKTISNVVSSKFDDWYMYSKHDLQYLEAKGLETKKYHYKDEDFKASDMDELNAKRHDISILHLTPVQAIKDAINDGMTFEEFFYTGRVAPHNINYYEKAFLVLMRNKRTITPPEKKKPEVDPPLLTDEFTGEVISQGLPVFDPATGERLDQATITQAEEVKDESKTEYLGGYINPEDCKKGGQKK